MGKFGKTGGQSSVGVPREADLHMIRREKKGKGKRKKRRGKQRRKEARKKGRNAERYDKWDKNNE